MSNPYEPPQAESLAGEPVPFSSDPKIRRATLLARVCCIAIGGIASAIAIAILAGSINKFLDSRSSAWQLSGWTLVSLILFASGVASIGMKRTGVLISAGLSVLGLCWIGLAWFNLPASRPSGISEESTPLFFVGVSLPELLILMFAVLFVLAARRIRKRRCFLAQQHSRS